MAISIKHGNEIRLGADPEFIILPAANDIPCTIHSHWNGDAGNYSRDGGSHSTGEIRPSPGSPREVTENIRTIVRRIRNEYTNHRLVVGGGQKFEKYVGGHIHFNVWDSVTESAPRDMVKALDFFIGRNLKLMNGGARYQHHYGEDGDCRMKSHGFEYRTAPSFIVDPTLTEAIFAVAYRIAELSLESSVIISSVGSTGRAVASDYDSLVPGSSPFTNYYRTQINNFKEYVFGGFDLSVDDSFDRWLAPIPFEFKAGNELVNVRVLREQHVRQAEQERIAALERLNREREERAAQMSQSIMGVNNMRTPTRCRIRHSAAANDINELMTYSTIPEIRIHQGFDWQARLNLTRPPSANRPWRRRSIRWENNVVYLSDSLKGKFKIPRTVGFKVKYVSITDNTNANVNAIVTNRAGMNLAELVTKILHSPKRHRQARVRA